MIKRDVMIFLAASESVRNCLGDRIYPNRANEGAPMPFAILRTPSGRSFNDLPGEAACVSTAIEVTIYGKDAGTVAESAEKVRNRLSGYKGQMGDSCCLGCAVQGPPSDFELRPRTRRGGSSSTEWVYGSVISFELIHTQELANNE